MSHLFTPPAKEGEDIYPDWLKRIDGILADSAASYSLKSALVVFDSRDPVDAAIDAALLAEIFKAKMSDVMGSDDPEEVADVLLTEHRSDDV